jgi:hypothetical protein
MFLKQNLKEEISMRYKVMVHINPLTDKIPAIKLHRLFTKDGLRESKEFVEEHILPKAGMDEAVTFILTQEQLGKYLIAIYMPSSGLSNLPAIRHMEEVQEPDFVDYSSRS